MVSFQHVSETTVSPFVQFPKGRVGWSASLCTVANWQPSTDSSPFPLDLELLSHALPPSSICLHPSFCYCSIVFSMEGISRKRPRYSCPDLNDDVVEELIDRCNVITSASMAGSFKTILDSSNNIITRNPRVQERLGIQQIAIFHRRQSPRSYLNVRRIPVCSTSWQFAEIFRSGTR